MSQVTLPDGTIVEADGCITITKPNHGDRLYINGSAYLANPEPCSESQAELMSYEEVDFLISDYLADVILEGEAPWIFFHPWGNDHWEIVAFSQSCPGPLIDHVYVSFADARALGEVHNIPLNWGDD